MKHNIYTVIDIPDKYPERPVYEEHPDDRKLRQQSQREGLAKAAKFVEANAAAIAKMFWLWPDDIAEAQYTLLREKFWTETE